MNLSQIISRLNSLLCQAQLLLPERDKPLPQFEDIYRKICELTLNDQVPHSLWHESILSQLTWLFREKPPNENLFGTHVQHLHSQQQKVHLVNDFFYSILNRSAAPEEVEKNLSALVQIDSTFLSRLLASGRLEKIRELDYAPSEKIASFVEYLKNDLNIDLTTLESVVGCLDALKKEEGMGRANALLVKPSQNTAIVIPLELQLSMGEGRVCSTVQSSEDFEKAIERAQKALQIGGFISPSQDVVYCLPLTDSKYTGSSLGLGAVACMFGAASKMIFDPFTAFTGDVQLEQGEWKVKGVEGISKKLEAARLFGCKRVFIPKENQEDTKGFDTDGLEIIEVGNIVEFLYQLNPSPQPLTEKTIQARKINALRTYCQASGWALPEPRLIQNGIQFRVAPLNQSELCVTIYDSGAHVPKEHTNVGYQALLEELAESGQTGVSIRSVNKPYNIQDKDLREKIRIGLEQLQPQEKGTEQYCDYYLKFKQGKENLVLKQYQKGKLLLQGSAGNLLKNVLDVIIPLYNLHNPNSNISVEGELGGGSNTVSTSPVTTQESQEIPKIPIPHIGTDESGKGDYFGPLVVAGVLIDHTTQASLESIGIKDSKLLSDKKCRELAAQIRKICAGKHEEIEILPERYNQLYEEFQREGQNLNHLLAWGHARAIESLLERSQCSHAVADQFGNEKYISSRLMQKGKQLNLTQLPKGERYLAVAAASILARDRFLTRMEKYSMDYGLDVPKGASDTVVKAGKGIVQKQGADELRKIAKLHHKTTEKIFQS